MHDVLKDATACPPRPPDRRQPARAGRAAGARAGRLGRARAAPRERGAELLRLLKRTGVEPGDTIEVVDAGPDGLRIATRAGDHDLALPVAQSVSVAVERRGDGPRADVPDLDDSALLASSAWGR